jgi:hypothetical protein
MAMLKQEKIDNIKTIINLPLAAIIKNTRPHNNF